MTAFKEAPEKLPDNTLTRWRRPAFRPARPADRSRFIVRVLTAATIVVLAMKIGLPQGVQVGFLVAVGFLPLWFGVVRRYRFGWSVLGLGVLALGAGVWLQMAGSGDRGTDSNVMNVQNVVLAGALVTVGFLLWARTVIPPTWIAVWYGVGLFLNINHSTALYASNPWKFGFFLPVAVITLAFAWMTKRWWVELLVILSLTGISAISDARSAFGLLILAAILIIAQLPFLRAGHKGSALLVFLGFVVVSAVVAVLGQAAILGGYLGAATQQRSLAQIQTSGSLILGGRPELAATIALLKHNPWGFGAGIEPSAADISVAKAGMASIGYDPENNYVNSYMFGGHFELHSVVGDFWTQSGIAGLIFVAIVLIALLWGLSRRIADGTASGLILFVGANAIWQTFFGPWQSAEPVIVFALGIVAVLVLGKGGDGTKVEVLDPAGKRLLEGTGRRRWPLS
jgi:hypothetical protein